MRRFFPHGILGWFGPIVSTGIAFVVVAGIVVVTGMYNIAASIPHPPGWAQLLHFSFERSVAQHASELSRPDDFDTEWRVVQGAGHYGHACAGCHGAPGLGQNVMALQERPQPQYLPEVVGEFSDKELAWIVLHGAKYTGMPSWTDTDREDEAWSVAAFLRRLPEMDYKTYRKLAYGTEGEITNLSLPAKFTQFEPTPESSKTKIPDPNTHRTSVPATGFTEFAMNNTLMSMCGRCHGADGLGRGIGAFPNLTLQNPEYLRRTLEAFAHGDRHSGFMRSVATQLSDNQIMALSAYYSLLPETRSPGSEALDAALIDEGRSIAENGVPERNVPACLSCHEQTKFTSRLFPHLNGQYVNYIESQLKLFAKGARGYAGDYGPMDELAHQLEPDEMKAVAAYFNAQKPTRPANAPGSSKDAESGQSEAGAAAAGAETPATAAPNGAAKPRPETSVDETDTSEAAGSPASDSPPAAGNAAIEGTADDSSAASTERGANPAVPVPAPTSSEADEEEAPASATPAE
ncbi:c-type cytochrome [Afifella sp. JA880]|uniref:c-type cytochrome n=1 Tax=Afifella sp. JA880 TaxID=2975280 RepID=UPI0021BB3FB2|nr:c-type cytochrome [Afifella sp. JA880]MCT8269064.1 c-type cytochrome [Afifella sp. JA880]